MKKVAGGGDLVGNQLYSICGVVDDVLQGAEQASSHDGSRKQRNEHELVPRAEHLGVQHGVCRGAVDLEVHRLQQQLQKFHEYHNHEGWEQSLNDVVHSLVTERLLQEWQQIDQLFYLGKPHG